MHIHGPTQPAMHVWIHYNPRRTQVTICLQRFVRTQSSSVLCVDVIEGLETPLWSPGPWVLTLPANTLVKRADKSEDI